MQENPLENTFYQFIVLASVIGGLLMIVFGMVTSHAEQTLLGILLFLIGLSFVASFVYKYWRIRP
jgi:uncharacterized membrane protein YbjE (DUF340 family)